MISSTPIAPPTRDLADAHWLAVLQDDLALLDGELWDERRSEHPGARHRVELLEKRKADRHRQIADMCLKIAAYSL